MKSLGRSLSKSSPKKLATSKMASISSIGYDQPNGMSTQHTQSMKGLTPNSKKSSKLNIKPLHSISGNDDLSSMFAKYTQNTTPRGNFSQFNTLKGMVSSGIPSTPGNISKVSYFNPSNDVKMLTTQNFSTQLSDYTKNERKAPFIPTLQIFTEACSPRNNSMTYNSTFSARNQKPFSDIYSPKGSSTNLKDLKAYSPRADGFMNKIPQSPKVRQTIIDTEIATPNNSAKQQGGLGKRKVHKLSMLASLQGSPRNSIDEIKENLPFDHITSNPGTPRQLNKVVIGSKHSRRVLSLSIDPKKKEEIIKRNMQIIVNNNLPTEKRKGKTSSATQDNMLNLPIEELSEPIFNKECLFKMGERDEVKGAFKVPVISDLKLATTIKTPHPLNSVLSKSDKESIQKSENSIKSVKSFTSLKKNRGQQLISILLAKLARLKQLNLTLREVMTDKVFPSHSYERKGSKEFIDAVKVGNMHSVEWMVSLYGRYVVYNYDNIYQTALHVAAKRGYYNIAEYIIGLGADVDAKDMTGRTPLFFAITNNHIEVVKLLLGSGANPWPTEEFDYEKLAKDNDWIMALLDKAKKLFAVIRMTTAKVRRSMWRKEKVSKVLRLLIENKDEAL